MIPAPAEGRGLSLAPRVPDRRARLRDRRHLPGFIMCSVERIATEWRTFFARDHWRFRSTQTTCVVTSAPSLPSRVARFASVCSQNLFSLPVAAHREAELAERVLRPHQHLRLRDRRARPPRAKRT